MAKHRIVLYLKECSLYSRKFYSLKYFFNHVKIPFLSVCINQIVVYRLINILNS